MLEPTHFPQFIVPRIEATVQRLEQQVWRRDESPVAVKATAPSPAFIGVQAAKRLAYKPVTKTPHYWGKMFDQRWWKLTLPKAKRGAGTRYLFWDDAAEATVYHQGEPIYGFDPGHRHCPLPVDARELVIESACCRSGVWVPGNAGPMSRHGSEFCGVFIETRDDTAYHAWIDLAVLAQTLALIHLPDYPAANTQPDSPYGYRPPIHLAPPIYRKVIRQLNDAIDVYEKSGTAALRRSLARVYRSLKTDNRSHTAVLTGHAHIDLVWLWPKKTAQFKAVHSFANALSVMGRHPKAHFGYSQPASYRDTQAIAPGLMKRVDAKVRQGTWEATGTMWVESDTQLPCGEALVRSFSLGREGFTEINGKRRGPGDVVWLPDTFGYSACIPQIMAGFGVPYFYTTKIHWGSATQFPYTSFRWRGNDGSEVLTHIIQDHYNQAATPGEMHKSALRHQQADVHDEILIPTGYGDGGGGPTDDMAERTERMSRLGLLGEAAGVPDVKWGRIDDFFDRLDTQRNKLPIWTGEMYLQYHRGVQTTHSDLKAAYRAAERALQALEAVHCATGRGPVDQELWRTLVFHQFHDCLPGSSIWEVCVQAVKELNGVTKTALQSARQQLDRKGGKPSVFNPLALDNYIVTDNRVAKVPALSGVTKAGLDALPVRMPTADRSRLQNDRVSVKFNARGEVRSLSIDGNPVALIAPGAQLWVIPDHPNVYDAWDIDRASLGTGEHVVSPAKVRIESKGTLNAAVCFTRKVGKQSAVTVRYRLDPVRPALLIEYDIDWHETKTLLKLAFPTHYRGKMARYGSPFGSTLRPQLPGPIETDAMFEVPGSRWAAVADEAERDGLMVVTDAKYGFGCMDGLLHVSLLRSAMITQPTPGPAPRGKPAPTYSDLGRHTIRLAIGRFNIDAPHEAQPAVLAETLFNPPIAYTGRPVSAGLEAVNAGPSLVPAWAKPIDKERWALRLHETLGHEGVCKVAASAVEQSVLDLNDVPQRKVTRRGVRVKPYQIVSLGLTRTQ